MAAQWKKYQSTFDKVDPQFPLMEVTNLFILSNVFSVKEIINNSSLYLVNSDVISDFPRITTHKIVEAGGITLGLSNGTLDEVEEKD